MMTKREIKQPKSDRDKKENKDNMDYCDDINSKHFSTR